MNLHVVAYPELVPADYEFVQSLRKEHNTLYPIISAHFTIVFSVPDMALEDFTAAIKTGLEGITAIRFCIRGAVINKDSFSDYYDAFLVPDEGFSKIVKLHDKLYAGALSRHHRLDVSNIPHMSVANSLDAQVIKRLVDKLNEQEMAIHGTISSLDIINYENRVITTLERVALQHLV